MKAVSPSYRCQAKVTSWLRALYYRRSNSPQHYAFVEEVELPAGKGTLMVFSVDDLEEMKAWLLSWGASAKVLEPVELREMIFREVESLIKLLT